MKSICVIAEDKELLMDRLLANSVPLLEISRLIGVQYDTLREKLKRRKHGDPNWHNRERIDHRGNWERAKRPSDDERDDRRIRLYDLTKQGDGITLADAVKESGIEESVCLAELESFCENSANGDRSMPPICTKSNGRYKAVLMKDPYHAKSRGLFKLAY